MVHFLFSLFVLLHGLAHLVYTAMARGLIPATATQPDLTGTSWLFAGLLGTQGTRNVGAVVFAALALMFTVVAGGLWLRQPWSGQWLAAAAFLSSLVLLAFWDGSMQDLTSKGLVGLVINVALLIAFYAFRYPAL